jgi:hypothetical protein
MGFLSLDNKANDVVYTSLEFPNIVAFILIHLVDMILLLYSGGFRGLDPYLQKLVVMNIDVNPNFLYFCMWDGTH